MLTRLQEEYADRGLKIVAINIEPRLSLERWRTYWRRLGGGEVIWAQDAQYAATTAFNVQRLGTEIIINAQGRVVSKGADLGYERLKRRLDEALQVG